MAKIFSTVIFCLCISCANDPARIPQLLHVHFINVGQGDCTLLTFPDGKNLLIDGGPVDNKEVVAYLKNQDISHITTLLITHGDLDHYGGLYAIVDSFSIGVMYANGSLHKDDYKSFLDYASSKGIVTQSVNRGMNIPGYGDIAVTVMHPDTFYDTTYTLTSLNDYSTVLRVSYKTIDFLFCGDIERQAEYYLADYFQEKLTSEVIKVPHHGSASSSTDSLLKFVMPQYAVISAGPYNQYNHPDSTILVRYDSLQAITYRTDIHGSIEFITDGEEITIKTEK